MTSDHIYIYVWPQVKDWHLTLVNAHVVTPQIDQLKNGKPHNGEAVPSHDPLSVIGSAIKKKLPGRSSVMADILEIRL